MPCMAPTGQRRAAVRDSVELAQRSRQPGNQCSDARIGSLSLRRVAGRGAEQLQTLQHQQRGDALCSLPELHSQDTSML